MRSGIATGFGEHNGRHNVRARRSVKTDSLMCCKNRLRLPAACWAAQHVARPLAGSRCRAHSRCHGHEPGSGPVGPLLRIAETEAWSFEWRDGVRRNGRRNECPRASESAATGYAGLRYEPFVTLCHFQTADRRLEPRPAATPSFRLSV